MFTRISLNLCFFDGEETSTNIMLAQIVLDGIKFSASLSLLCPKLKSLLTYITIKERKFVYIYVNT